MANNDEYTPINCDDYEYLELACQHNLVLSIKLRGGELVLGTANDLLLKKQVEYLIVDVDGESRELRLDHIASFTHDRFGTIVISLA